MDITEALSQVNWTDPWSIALSSPILLHILAKIYVSVTNTPKQGTTWSKVYKGIEVLAGIAGKVKQEGIIPERSRAKEAEANGQ